MTSINASSNYRLASIRQNEPAQTPQPIKPNNVAFGCSDECCCEKEPKAKKHPFKAIASFLLPGSGQVANGEIAKGAKHFGIALGIGMTTMLLMRKQFTGLNKALTKVSEELASAAPESVNKVFNDINHKLDKSIEKSFTLKGLARNALAGMAIFAGIGTRIFSARDAYREGK